MISVCDESFLPKGYVELIGRELAYWHVPGFSAAVVQGDRPVLLGAWGLRDTAKGLPFTVDTTTGIGSCSKSMTSFVAACLADEGILDLDAPLRSYLPDFAMYDPCASRDLCLRDMLSHRSGLGGHDGTWPDNSISRAEYLHRLRYLQPNKPFRSEAQYSNVMFAAVGAVEELVTGKTWEELVQTYVWDKLGMAHTYADMGPAQADPDHALPYAVRGGKPCVLKPWNIDMAGPCGSVMSSASDMAKWISLHIAGGVWQGQRLVSAGNFAQLHKPVNIMDFPVVHDFAVSMGYALGWRAVQYRGCPLQQHSGKIEGYSAFQFYLPEQKVGGAFLMNMHEPANELFFSLACTLLDRVLGLEPQNWPQLLHPSPAAPEGKYHLCEMNWMPKSSPVPGTKPSHPLEAYTGTYWNGGYGRVTIALKNNALTFTLRDICTCLMTHFHYDVFQVDGIKEDTNTIIAPAAFETDPDTGMICALRARLEPMVDDIVFQRVP
jgi:CubicO group peptidase (beta-lactamase class C family)